MRGGRRQIVGTGVPDGPCIYYTTNKFGTQYHTVPTFLLPSPAEKGAKVGVPRSEQSRALGVHEAVDEEIISNRNNAFTILFSFIYFLFLYIINNYIILKPYINIKPHRNLPRVSMRLFNTILVI